jgi:hypothetical protein
MFANDSVTKYNGWYSVILELKCRNYGYFCVAALAGSKGACLALSERQYSNSPKLDNNPAP